MAIPDKMFARSAWLIEEAQKLIVEPLGRVSCAKAAGSNMLRRLLNQMPHCSMVRKRLSTANTRLRSGARGRRRRVLYGRWSVPAAVRSLRSRRLI